jgi:hypothetical protein
MVLLFRRKGSGLRIVLAMGLGLATIVGIGGLSTVTSISDVLGMPGFVLGWVLASGGVHDVHAMLWIASFVFGNMLFYSIAWWFVIGLIAKLRRRGTV